MKQDAINELRKLLEGPLLEQGDPGYDEARSVWNGMIDRRPALIVQCKSVADIVAAIAFARENKMVVSIKGGGHGVAGKAVCENGLMFDMSQMKSVSVDPDTLTARVGPGAALRDLDRETSKHGLFTTGGIVSTTGVAGLTLGGGMGYLARKYGLTIDNLLSADLVTADGKLLHCSEKENSDLFWALRGGGGNFGLVSSFEFELHRQDPEILAAQIFYPMKDAPEVMQRYRQLLTNAPDELVAYAFVANVPPAEPFPSELHGTPSFFFLACHSGDHEEGRKLLKPFQEIGDPILSVVEPMAYTALQQTFNEGMPKGGRYYWKSHFMREISDDAIETFLRYGEKIMGSMTMLGIEPLGGAIGRVAAGETAFVGRDEKFAVSVWAGWRDPLKDQEIISWARNFHQAMAPFASDGLYSNYMDQDDEERVLAAYGGNYERLQSIKSKYDPDNFFSQNFNISPEK